MSDMGACYRCIHRGGVPGSAHSSCNVLKAKTGKPGGEMMAAMVMMTEGQVSLPDYDLLVQGNPHGVRSGWFMWPVDYDPAWLTKCTVFNDGADSTPTGQASA